MFIKVPKLKKFGIFRDFSWGSDTPDFARFNLIYGWNKSGKTTFSRIFSACEKKTIDFVQYPKDKDGNLGEFEITTDSGTTIKHSDCQNGTKQIQVFNKDFIEDNVSFDPLNPSNPIVYVSEEDIESNKKLKELRGNVALLSQKFESYQKDRQKGEKAYGRGPEDQGPENRPGGTAGRGQECREFFQAHPLAARALSQGGV